MSDILGWVLGGLEASGQRANSLVEPVVGGKFMQVIASHHNDCRGAEAWRTRYLVNDTICCDTYCTLWRNDVLACSKTG